MIAMIKLSAVCGEAYHHGHMSVDKTSSKWSTKARSHVGSSSAATSSSFFGLKAELERARSETSNNIESAKHSQKRKGKTDAQDASLTYWDKRVKTKPLPTYRSESTRKSVNGLDLQRNGSSVKKRGKRDDEAPTKAQLEAIRRNMERKANIYAQLEAGKYAGIDDDQLAESSIDWQRKALEAPPNAYRSATRHSPTPPPAHSFEDAGPEVEYLDEFGRTRTAVLSEVPREFLSTIPGYHQEEEERSIAGNEVYGPATHFPVYTPTLPRVTKSHATSSHFDSEAEKRHLGAAFYKFSREEGTRSQQMDQLEQLRQQTLLARASSTPKST